MAAPGVAAVALPITLPSHAATSPVASPVTCPLSYPRFTHGCLFFSPLLCFTYLVFFFFLSLLRLPVVPSHLCLTCHNLSFLSSTYLFLPLTFPFASSVMTFFFTFPFICWYFSHFLLHMLHCRSCSSTAPSSFSFTPCTSYLSSCCSSPLYLIPLFIFALISLLHFCF